MARQRIRKKPMAEINVVPYIDVMLVMLVIFMITAPLLTQGVKVDLPQASAEVLPADQQEPLVVNVDAEGRMYLNIGTTPNDPVDAETLVEKVAAVIRRRHDRSVLVRGDHAVDYGTVVAAMVLLQQAGVPNVGLVTEPPEK
ncbi:MAG: protein TolR [Gammaproteobacteria bacterium]